MLKFFLVFIFCVLYCLKLCPSVSYKGRKKPFMFELKKQVRDKKKKKKKVYQSFRG